MEEKVHRRARSIRSEKNILLRVVIILKRKKKGSTTSD